MLSAGMTLGPYEIVAPLGAGGMGEVYRATDTNLKRQVAIKVLPESLAADPDRLARFQREAEVLASLNHPNIAAIYGLEEGPAEAGPHVKALVMELVEGPTLAERLSGVASDFSSPWMWAMFGWFSAARTSASRWKRARRSGSAATACGSTLMATWRFRFVSVAR